MKPFDLPDNLVDLLHADHCRPTEERQMQISKALDGADREQPHDPARRDEALRIGVGDSVDVADEPHVDPPAVPTLPEPLPPGRFLTTPPPQRQQRRVDGSFIFTPLRRAPEPPPPGRLIMS
jgi:hypothetical protein